MTGRRSRSALLLTAVVSVLALESLRATGPVLAHVAGSGGAVVAVVAAAVGFVAPAVLGPLLGWLGPGRMTVAAVGGLVALRLVQQLRTPGLLTTLLTAVVALLAVLLCATLAGGRPAATGLVLGGALSAAVAAVFGGWDPLWRSGVWSWAYPVMLGVVALVLLARCAPMPAEYALGAAGPAARRGLVVGLFLALDVLMLANPAAVSRVSGAGLPFACAVLLVGALLAIEAVSRLRLPDGAGRLSWWWGAVALVAGLAVAGRWPLGAFGAALVLLAQVGVAMVLAHVLAARPGPTGESAGALAGLALGLGFLLVPLAGLAGAAGATLVPVAAGVVLAAAAATVRGAPRRDAPDPDDRDERRRERRGRLAPMAGVPAVLLVVPVVLLMLSAPPARHAGPADTLRLVSWNVREGRAGDGAVDAGAVARALAAARPDVALLQEVGRGSVTGGGLDLAEYLSRTLGMGYAWAPEGGGATGNLVLSRLPLSAVRTGALAGDGGPAGSYASAAVALPSGKRVTVLTTRLPHEAAGRRPRLAALLGRWGHATPAVLAGDLNAQPGSPEIASVQAAGLASAQDGRGQAGAATAPSAGSASRPDWVFGTPDVEFLGFALPPAGVSDHLPLSVTARIG